MNDHLVRAGDLVRIEYWRGSSLSFFTYGMVMVGPTRERPLIELTSTYFAKVTVDFDVIRIPADQIGPGAEAVRIPHGYTQLDPDDTFEFNAEIEVVVSPS